MVEVLGVDVVHASVGVRYGDLRGSYAEDAFDGCVDVSHHEGSSLLVVSLGSAGHGAVHDAADSLYVYADEDFHRITIIGLC